MKINLKVSTRVLAEPQTLEVSDNEANRLLMLGVAELEKKVEKVELKEEQPELKEKKKATKK